MFAEEKRIPDEKSTEEKARHYWLVVVPELIVGKNSRLTTGLSPIVRPTHSLRGTTVAGITDLRDHEQQQHYFAVRLCGGFDYSGRPSAFQAHRADGISFNEHTKENQ